MAEAAQATTAQGGSVAESNKIGEVEATLMVAGNMMGSGVFMFPANLEYDIPVDAMKKADDFIWLLEDTTYFIGGRIVAAIERYCNKVLPPMFGALARFSQVYEYSWHTPGHTGGTAFIKSPVSLLDHSGPIGESEKYAAGVFGAHRTYHVTNGSSTSNIFDFNIIIADFHSLSTDLLIVDNLNSALQ
ncbi:hypothetical protein ACTFIZ_012872 [Dictyostelium cf. discoideum]